MPALELITAYGESQPREEWAYGFSDCVLSVANVHIAPLHARNEGSGSA